MLRTTWLFTLCALTVVSTQALGESVCGNTPVALQVLGSGGPVSDGRASSGYIVWVDGESRIMVDAGGGTFLRFHEADGEVGDLELLALSHFHPDHASEVPALLWLQSGDLPVSGPTGSEAYPSVNEYLEGSFGPEGVFRVIGERMNLEGITVDVTSREPTEVFSSGDIRVRGIGVPHGNVPAIGYRIDIGDVSIGFSSDQNGSNPAFTELVTGVDVLVVHFAASERASGFLATLHARPSVWGQMATNAGAGTLVLSHLTGQGEIEQLRTTWEGPVISAEDLICIPVAASAVDGDE